MQQHHSLLEHYKNHINNSFNLSNKNKSKINNDIIRMEGMTRTKTRHFYNNLLDFQDARYLEIGSYKGSSVCSAMYQNNATVLCIDNWSEFGGPKDEFLFNFNKYKGNNNANFIENDCFKIEPYTLPKFNIFMYYGNHTYDSHYKALFHFYDCLDDTFIYIVDDWNWKHVRDSTNDSIQKLNLNVLYIKEIILTNDDSITPEPELSNNWWNGICIFILKKKHFSFNVNYNNYSTELCNIGRDYDTDKSSQRYNVSNIRHCHPYTIFYDNLFKSKRNEVLNIAEVGILHGASLLMWHKYFPSSFIHGFEYNQHYINNFIEQYNDSRFYLSNMNIKNKDSIIQAFKTKNIQYDIIIEDSTHEFEDQIRFIENVADYLKPGGILIIENIFKSYNEYDYISRLSNILTLFQEYYFISVDHQNRNSTDWNNDKLFILIKGGSPPIFKNQTKISIITPSYRTDNLHIIKNSIPLHMDFIKEWIIVYDGTKVIENPHIFKNCDKIKEYIHSGEGISGNPQRNFALSLLYKTNNNNEFVYFLDDDNYIHPDFHQLHNIIDINNIYTFDSNNIKGCIPYCGKIDTAQFLIPIKLCENIYWQHDIYWADGMFIEYIYEQNKEKHIYINNTLTDYNLLRK